MAGAGDEEQDAVLSDVEEDDPVPINIHAPTPEDVSIDKVRELMAELDRERKEREAAEKAKSELQVSFNRLKALAHDSIRKRDESSKQRDEALREKEEALKTVERVSLELTEATKGKDEVLKQLEEMTRAKDSSRSEIETAASMLVGGIEKISGKVSNFKNFMAGGLPRSQKYTGLPAVAYGVIKRTNEIVEELLRQIALTTQSRNEIRESMEQRNYEIAIEVSELEATISGLREEVSRKSLEIEKLEKSIGENDEKLGEWREKQRAMEKEELDLRNLIREQDDKLRSLETKMSLQRSLLIEQLNYVTKVHREISNVVKIVDASKYSELSESLFMAKETDAEENIRASLAGMESIYELSQFVVVKTRELIDERNREVRSRDEMVSQLIKEKEQIGSLLRSALSRRTSVDLSSKTNELFKVAENGLKAAGIDYKFSNHLGEGKVSEAISVDAEEDEVYALAGALEDIIKQSQVEIIDLKHSLDDLRAESSILKQQVETQREEFNHWRQRVDELEEKERVANANLEGLMLDITAAEEEITRWKVAAQQEADAGKAVEEDYSRQLSALRQELEEAKQAVIEREKKLKFKEETATAAMAARAAAEKSLRLADIRSTRLRERTEELTRQLEELDTREPSRSGLSRPRYMCWPWEWLGIDFIGSQRLEQPQPQQRTNEMELLSEPLL